MTSVSSGRAGLPIHLSGFVVAEEQTLQARLNRSYRTTRSQAEVAVARFQHGARRMAAVAGRENPVLIRFRQISARLRAAILAGHARVMQSLGPLQGPAMRMARAIRPALALVGPALAAAVRPVLHALWSAPPAVKAGALMLSIIPVGISSLSRQTEEVPVAAMTLRAAAQETLPSDPWRYVTAPIAAYNLESSELGRAAPVYRVRTNASGGRQDIMIWGEGGVQPTSARASVAGGLVVERRGGTSPSDSLYVETARRAALVGASIVRMAQALELETKFGLAEIAETQIESLGKGYSCQSFRVTGDYSLLRVNGWFCGTGARPVTRDSLGCLIDRLDLMAAGNDKQLRSWFAAAERVRKACGEPRAVTVKPGSEPMQQRPAARGAEGLRLKLADG